MNESRVVVVAVPAPQTSQVSVMSDRINKAVDQLSEAGYSVTSTSTAATDSLIFVTLLCHRVPAEELEFNHKALDAMLHGQRDEV